MKITVYVKPSAKQNKIEQQPDGSFRVHVKERAQEGKANTAMIKVLAHFLHKSQSDLTIVSGTKNRKKIARKTRIEPMMKPRALRFSTVTNNTKSGEQANQSGPRCKPARL